MTTTDNANKMLVDTDYPLDKVIYMVSGSFSATGGGGVGSHIHITHGLSFTPLVVGTWSLNSNFSTSREGGNFALEGTDPTTVYTQFYANSTQITAETFNPGSTATVYYRIYGFMPSNVDSIASSTADIADNFTLNTDYNYTKLFDSGISTATATRTIIHNLGYRPQVMAWTKDSSAYGTSMIVDIGYVKVTTTTIVITSPTYDVHYRIYLDGQI